jgi:hypothetical protein
MKSALNLSLEHMKELQQQTFIPEQVKEGIGHCIKLSEMALDYDEVERRNLAIGFISYFLDNNKMAMYSKEKSMDVLYQNYIQSLKTETNETNRK